jgi:diguanylate cyclase (GGDEF)-like protein
VPHFDLFTLKVATLVTVLTVSLYTLMAWKINRPVAGMRQFAVGLFLICVGSVVGISRLVVPGKLVLIAGNVVTVGGLIMAVQGIREFRGFPPLPSAAIIFFAAITAAPFLYWMYGHDSFGMRVGVISAAQVVLAVDASVSMFRRVPADDRRTYWPTAASFAFTAGFIGVRSVAAFAGHYGNSLLAPVPIEIPLSFCAAVAFVGCAFGMLLASNTHMRHTAERMALFDPLTGLPNRRVLLDRLLEAEQRAVQSGSQLGVIYMDLDGFKLVNDTLGHGVGDDLLRNVSAAMMPMLGPGDCLARVGGDEFVALVEDVEGQHELSILAGRLKAAVEGERIPGRNGNVRVSCGTALFPDDGHTAHDVMREADMAMYHAKRQRRAPAHNAA